MGYELNKLMQQFGVSSPTIMYSGGLSAEQRPAFDQYKADYMKRINDTSLYGPPQANPHLKLPAQQPQQQSQWAQPLKAPVFDPAPSGDFVKASAANAGGGGAGGAGTLNQVAGSIPQQTIQTTQPTSGGSIFAGGTAPGEGSTSTKTTAQPGWYQDAVYNHMQNVQNIASQPMQQYELPTVAGLSPEQLRAVQLTNSSVGQYQPYIDQSLQRLRGFADGGLVDDGLMPPNEQEEDKGNYAMWNLLPKAMAASQPAPQPQRMDMQSLMEKYLQPSQNNYAAELKAAREQAAKHQMAFEQTVQRAMEGQGDSGPSKSELYARLAQAFGTPGKTGHFSEGVANAAGVFADHEREGRLAQRAGEQAKLKMAMELQDRRMKDSKVDVDTLRALASDESKSDREVKSKLLADYIKSGQPQSEAGKIAMDAGFQPGTPEYTKYVDKYVTQKMESGELYKQAMLAVAQGSLGVQQANQTLAAQKFDVAKEQGKKLTPTELKLKTETEDLLSATNEGMAALAQAYKLNPNTFDGTYGDKARRLVLENTNSDDPQVVATRTQENLLSNKAIAGLRAAFGGNPTEGERKIILELQGIGAKSKEERKIIMKNAYAELKRKQALQSQRLGDVSSGKVRLVTPMAEPQLGEE